MKVMGKDSIQINRTTVDLRYLEQLSDIEQLSALAYLLTCAAKHHFRNGRTLTEVVDLLEQQLEKKGLASLSDSSYLPSNLARPRRQEIFACFNRCRDVTFSIPVSVR